MERERLQTVIHRQLGGTRPCGSGSRAVVGLKLLAIAVQIQQRKQAPYSISVFCWRGATSVQATYVCLLLKNSQDVLLPDFDDLDQ